MCQLSKSSGNQKVSVKVRIGELRKVELVQSLDMPTKAMWNIMRIGGVEYNKVLKRVERWAPAVSFRP